MQVTLDQKVHEVPFTLADITLEKFIEYYDKYGRSLDKEIEEIQKTDYVKEYGEDAEVQKEVDLDIHLDNEAIAWYSFWTKSDLSDAKNHPEILPMLTQYRVLKYMLIQDENEAKNFPIDVNWKGETWHIQNFTVNPASQMTFNEIITSKEVIRQISAIGKSRWEAMPYLCAVFFRKKGEAFTDELVEEGSDRMYELLQLPMSHVLRVAFFLSACVSIWKNTSLSSAEKDVQETTNPL
jgi:hypothetical protein